MSFTPHYRSYVICTNPRSGSTLLCKLLAATGKAGNPQSYFHNPSVSDWLHDFGLASINVTQKRDVLRAIFDVAIERGTCNTNFFGLRLQGKSVDFLIQQMRELSHGYSGDLELFQSVFGTTLFIHLTRVNKLDQAISLVKANQTGLWHMAPDGTELERLSAPQEPAYNADDITKKMFEMKALDKKWDDLFEAEKIDLMRITYEELSADPTAVLAQILDHLGLDRKLAAGIVPATAKLADAVNRNWAKRYLAEKS